MNCSDTLKLRFVGLPDRRELIQALGKKLTNQAAFVAAKNDAGAVNSLHQFGRSFEGKQPLRVGFNVNSHAVITRDDTVLSRRKTPVYNWDLSDEKDDLALYALLSLSGCRG